MRIHIQAGTRKSGNCNATDRTDSQLVVAAFDGWATEREHQHDVLLRPCP